MLRRLFVLAAALLCAFPGGAGGQPPTASTKSAESLYALYLARDYFELTAQLGNLAPEDQRRAFFAGQVDAAFARDGAAEENLRRFLSMPDAPPDWRKEAWLTLGNTHLRGGDYENAARELDRALKDPGVTFTPTERLDVEQNLAVARVLRGSPPPSRADHTGPSKVDATRGMGGWLFMDVSVNGMTQQMLVDTGANSCAATETFARLHKIQVLPDRVEVIAGTGKSFFAHVGLADTVQVGKMVFHHVVFLVVRNEDAAISGFGVTMDGVVGLPLIAALEHLRVDADGGSVEVGGASSGAPEGVPDKNLAYHGLNLLVRVQYQDHAVPFVLDTGSNQTLLYSQFTRRFPQAVAGVPYQTGFQAGIGSQIIFSDRVPPQIALGVHGLPVTLHDAVALDNDSSYEPAVYGLAGANLLRGGFELDFRRMELSLTGSGN